MVVGCPNCNTRYRLDPAKIPATGQRVRCTKCTHVFGVAPPVAAAPQPTMQGHPAHTEPPRPAQRAATAQASAAGAGATGGAVPGGGAPTPSPTPPPPIPSTDSIPLARPTEPPPAPPAPEHDPAPDSDPTEPNWLMADETGELIPHDRTALRDLIRRGSLAEDTILVPEGGQEPLTAGEIPELQRYFRLARTTGATPGAVAAGAIASTATGGQGAGMCVNHPAKPAAFVCNSCSTLFCTACVADKEFGTTRVKWCKQCDDRCVAYDGVRHVVPFWRELPRLLTYPLAGWGPFMILCCGILSLMGGFLPGPGKALYFFVLAYQLHILKESAYGNKKLPDWPDTSDMWEIISRGVKTVLVSFIVWLPLIAFNVIFFAGMLNAFTAQSTDVTPQSIAEASAQAEPHGVSAVVPAQYDSNDDEIKMEDYVDEEGNFDFDSYAADMEAQGEWEGDSYAYGDEAAMPDQELVAMLLGAGVVFLGVNLILFVAIGLYYPMCLMIAAIFNTVFPALNPVLILRCIGRVKFDYFICLLVCGVMGFISVVAQAILGIIPILGPIVGAFIATYFAFIQMHIFGWTAYQGWDRLNWDIKI